MSIRLSGDEVILSWTDVGSNYVLKESVDLTKWFRSGWPIAARSNDEAVVAVSRFGPPARFFRLSRPTSDELIDSALARGAIDAETALIYKVYVSFDDDRLPSGFRGDDTGIWESTIMAEVVERFESLSSSAQATLLPFRIPPVYSGSWWALRNPTAADRSAASDLPLCGQATNSWNNQEFAIPGGTGRVVRFWWPKNQPFWSRAGGGIQRAVQRIWPDLSAMMGNGSNPREPLSDASEACNGGSEAYDIYIARLSGRASTTAIRMLRQESAES